jgi:hypothetical protein
MRCSNIKKYNQPSADKMDAGNNGLFSNPFYPD